jgi:hypothetical protein
MHYVFQRASVRPGFLALWNWGQVKRREQRAHARTHAPTHARTHALPSL